MLVKLVPILILLHEVTGQLNLLGIKLPLDLDLSKGKQTKGTTIAPTTVIPHKGCERSITLYPSGEPACKNRLIFEDNFDNAIVNKNKWVIEQYTPIINGPDYEFVSYQKTDKTLFVRDGKLFLKPEAHKNEEDVKGILDLKEGCTRKTDSECYYEQQAVFILPPVTSAKVTSKFSFTYGRIDVRAKMPSGDWIFPQLELVPRLASKDGVKMWIGYTRGNDYLLDPNTGDTGSKVLFAGPILGATEPEKTLVVFNRSSAAAYNKDMHVYSLKWEPGQITGLVDGEVYGVATLDTSDRRFSPFNNDFHITFGVGVGGINDFPDNFLSSRPKPWKNMDRRQAKDFFDAREKWLKTWNGDDIALQIDYVKIWAL